MSTATELTATNVGPIEEASIKLADYGVTVLSAPNGAGKSILLNAVQSLAKGSGKLPLKDGERRGSLEGFGARITIGASTRHNGEFQVANLEGRFDLGLLVDPKLKSAEAADRKRIAALVAITGATAVPSRFAHLPLFEETISAETRVCTDLVEMASKIKSEYEAAARISEKAADINTGRAAGLDDAIAGVDLDVECDAEKLRARYDEALAAKARIDEQELQAEAQSKRRSEAEARLAQLEYSGPTVDEAEQAVAEADAYVKELSEQLREAEARLSKRATDLTMARMHADRLHLIREVLDEALIEPPSAAAIEEAATELDRAAVAIDNGALVREARDKVEERQRYINNATAEREQAAALRDAASRTGDVLSDAIQSDRFSIRNLDGEARVVVDHPRGKDTPYHELSCGERWRFAIDEGADRVGEGGLLVVDQEAWEGLDAFVRPQIHEHAIERKVYILTAEATRHAKDGGEMVARGFEG